MLDVLGHLLFIECVSQGESKPASIAGSGCDGKKIALQMEQIVLTSTDHTMSKIGCETSIPCISSFVKFLPGDGSRERVSSTVCRGELHSGYHSNAIFLAIHNQTL